MQDQNQPNPSLPPQPNPGQLAKPITSGDPPTNDAPASQDELLAMLQKNEQNDLAQPLKVVGPRPGHVVEPISSPAPPPTPVIPKPAPPPSPPKPMPAPPVAPLPTGPPPITPPPIVRPPTPAPPRPAPPPPPTLPKPAPPPPVPKPTPPPISATPKPTAPVPQNTSAAATAPSPIPPAKEPEPEQAPKIKRQFELPSFDLPRLPRPSLNLDWVGHTGGLLVPAIAVVVIALLLVLPASRYRLAGLFVKHELSVRVLDATTGLPVSDAEVTSGSDSVETDSSGVASLPNLRPGQHELQVSKANYDGQNFSQFVGFRAPKNLSPISLSSTGNLIELTLKNIVTKQSLANVQLKSGDVTAHSGSNGKALLALPVGDSNPSIALGLAGFSTRTASVSATAGSVTQATLDMTPSGKVFYFGSISGKTALYRVSLDGSKPEIIMRRTGYEGSEARLAVSADRQFVALRLRRTADPHAEIYVENTKTLQTSEIAFGQASFTLYGWVGDTVIYGVSYDATVAAHWANGQALLKSYNALTGKSTTLARSIGVGNKTSWAQQTYPFVMLSSGKIIYASEWQTSADHNASLLAGKNNTLNLINPSGSGAQTVAGYDAATYSLTYQQYLPDSLYIRRISSAGAADQFFGYRLGDAQPAPTQIDLTQFDSANPIYWSLPGGALTAWDQGKVVIGDSDGQNAQTLAGTDGYIVRGWQGDSYLLLSRGSGLYIEGLNGGQPYKLVDNYFGS